MRSLLALLAVALLVTCTDADSSSCGAKLTLEATASYRVSRSAAGSLSRMDWYPASYDGSRVHFRFDSDLLENVCSADEVKSNMLVRFTGEPPAGTTVTATVPYASLLEQPIPLTYSCSSGECAWQGQTNVGLSHAYSSGTLPGRLYVWLDISWPSVAGNRVADSVLFYHD